MAQKVEVKYFSDLNPEVEAAETVNWALDGTQYEIDLTEKEAAALRKSLGKYKEAARKVSGPGRRKSPSSASTRNGGGPDTKAVREWARSQGYQVTDRGRIPTEIMEKYQATH